MNDEEYFQACLKSLGTWYSKFGGNPKAFEAFRSIYLSILAYRLLEIDEPNFEENLDITLSAHRQHILDRLDDLRKEFKKNCERRRSDDTL